MYESAIHCIGVLFSVVLGAIFTYPSPESLHTYVFSYRSVGHAVVPKNISVHSDEVKQVRVHALFSTSLCCGGGFSSVFLKPYVFSLLPSYFAVTRQWLGFVIGAVTPITSTLGFPFERSLVVKTQVNSAGQLRNGRLAPGA